MHGVSQGRAAAGLVVAGVVLAGLPGLSVSPALAEQAVCPRVLSTTITPDTVRGGDGAVQTVHLAAPAARPFSFVDLHSFDYAYQVTVPGGIRVPAGQSSISFPIRLSAPGKRVVEDFEAVNGSCSAKPAHTTVTELPLDPANLAVSQVRFSRAGAVKGETVMATVELTAPARSAGTGVRLYDYYSGGGGSSFTGYPFIAVVPAGRTSVTFPVRVVDGLGDAPLAATLSTSDALGSLFISPDHLAVTGGVNSSGPTQARVGLGEHAPAAGTTVRVSTTSPGVHVPPTLKVAAGAVGAAFRITIDPGTDVNGKTITVREGGRTYTTDLFF